MSFIRVFYDDDSLQVGALEMHQGFAMNTKQPPGVYS